MPPVPKPVKVHSRPHLDYVSRCGCVLCSGVFYLDSPEKRREFIQRNLRRDRVSDPHHLASVIGNRRRTSDLTVIPLCRLHHDWVAGQQGKVWEREYDQFLTLLGLEYAVLSGALPRDFSPEGGIDEVVHAAHSIFNSSQDKSESRSRGRVSKKKITSKKKIPSRRFGT